MIASIWNTCVASAVLAVSVFGTAQAQSLEQRWVLLGSTNDKTMFQVADLKSAEINQDIVDINIVNVFPLGRYRGYGMGKHRFYCRSKSYSVGAITSFQWNGDEVRLPRPPEPEVTKHTTYGRLAREVLDNVCHFVGLRYEETVEGAELFDIMTRFKVSNAGYSVSAGTTTNDLSGRPAFYNGMTWFYAENGSVAMSRDFREEVIFYGNRWMTRDDPNFAAWAKPPVSKATIEGVLAAIDVMATRPPVAQQK